MKQTTKLDRVNLITADLDELLNQEDAADASSKKHVVFLDNFDMERHLQELIVGTNWLMRDHENRCLVVVDSTVRREKSHPDGDSRRKVK